jgi:phosphohistidine phosphatase
MDVILLRHADAGAPDLTRYPDDRSRPLSVRGREVHPRVATVLARMGVVFDRVLTSPLLRARETAELTRRAFDWPGQIEATEALGDGCSVDAIFALVGGQAPDARVLLVGHEPHLSRFAAASLAGAPRFDIDLRPSGVIGLAWREPPRPGGATLRYVLRPEQLTAI